MLQPLIKFSVIHNILPLLVLQTVHKRTLQCRGGGIWWAKVHATGFQDFWVWMLPVTGFRNFRKQISSQTLLKIFRHQEIQRYIDTLNLYRHQTSCSFDSASTFDEENTYSNALKYSAEAPVNSATYWQTKFTSIRNICLLQRIYLIDIKRQTYGVNFANMCQEPFFSVDLYWTWPNRIIPWDSFCIVNH